MLFFKSGSGSGFKILICRIRIRPKMDRIRNPRVGTLTWYRYSPPRPCCADAAGPQRRREPVRGEGGDGGERGPGQVYLRLVSSHRGLPLRQVIHMVLLPAWKRLFHEIWDLWIFVIKQFMMLKILPRANFKANSRNRNLLQLIRNSPLATLDSSVPYRM